MTYIFPLSYNDDVQYSPFANRSFPWMMLPTVSDTEKCDNCTSSLVPRLDVISRDNAYTCLFELPGVSADNVTLSIQDNVLSLHGEKKEEVRDDTKKYVTERSFGSFSREITLPEDIDTDHVTATQKDGVLTITIPRIAPRETKKSIEIQKA